ncbi:MAG: type III-B CRISPR-associated protein Cas10/Cmr2 [Bacteroidota bacterium]
MNITTLKLKLLALLHDPAEKAAILMQTAHSHEEVAREQIKIIFGAEQEVPHAVITADHIASAADRYNFPREGKYYAQRFLASPEIRHPLSGSAIGLQPMQLTNLDALQENVTNAIRKVAETYNDADESRRLWLRYLSLWRELPELLKQEEFGREKFGELWDLLPADTRIPDHSIWDHKYLTSALVGAGIHENRAALLLFSIGPVQEFISASRKTVDLWSGSYLLSFLSWQAMKVVCEECGPDAIIFPYLYGQPLVDIWLRDQGLKLVEEPSAALNSVASLPNRFFAIIPNDIAEELAQKAHDQVLNEFGKISDDAYGKIRSERQQWENQINNFLECYWVVLPIPRIVAKDGQTLADAFKQMYRDVLIWNNRSAESVLQAFGNAQFPLNIGALYGRLYNIIEQMHGARKVLRDFKQLPEPGYRCSLIPSLAAAIPHPDCQPRELKEFWHDVAQNNPGSIKASERLSPVAASKRFFLEYLNKIRLKPAQKTDQDFSSFPSTSEVAAADFKLAVLGKASQDEELKNALQNLTRAVTDLKNQLKDTVVSETVPKVKLSPAYRSFREFADLDGEWFFTESYDPKRLSREYGVEVDTTEPLSALQRLLKRTDDLGIPRPSKYYAIVMLDGDNTGKWLSGECSPLFRDALHRGVLNELENTNDENWKKLLGDDVRRPHAPSQHIAISRALNGFSLQVVRHIVEEEYLGKLVYAGGDDVLAFVSFEDALPMLRKLRAAFSGYLNENFDIDWTQQTGFVVLTINGVKRKILTMGPTSSASAGLVVAHHTQPLQQVLAALRIAERDAKGKYGRNAFAISILKRSGDQLISGSKWYYSESNIDVIEVMKKFASLVRESKLATSFIVDWRDELDGLMGLKNVEEQLTELKRIFMRHSSSNLEQPEKLKNFDDTIPRLINPCGMEKAYNLFATAQFFAKGGAR